MDGKTALRAMLRALNESGFSNSYLNRQEAFSKLDEAAVDFARRTLCLTGSVVLSMVEGQQAYDLPPDFIRLSARNSRRLFFGIFEDPAGNKSYPVQTSFEKIRRFEHTEVEIPGAFAIIDKQARPDLVTGAASETSSAGSDGESTLTDEGWNFNPAAEFLGAVYPRDIVHNKDQETDGVVLAVVSDTELVTALFDSDGNPGGWNGGNDYTILPTARNQIYLPAPIAESGGTLTLDYICLPGPVWSDYSLWRFQPMSCHAICKEAAALFLDQQKEWDVARGLHGEFAREIHQASRETAQKSLQQGRRYATR
ncbi:hypothetical protein [Desulfatibacillum aliphaticivorans]|uniref:hypothetical protein n=1 Tax=Desulfatibacillum aliphaticivorans TaxID=218208 RepID=UPI0003FD9A2B|nr:hypothetical protein [Desulfatibacillum aliphaticivorans]